MVVTAAMAIEAIQMAKKVTETAPVIVNAANHIVANGIRSGGYDVLSRAWAGIGANAGSMSSFKDVGGAALQGLQDFQGSGSLVQDISTLGSNVKSRFVVPKAAPANPQLGAADAFNATDKLNHAVTETASGASSLLSSVGTAAMKGGAVGIAIGITTETIALSQKYKNGEITKEEYVKEVAKSGAQMGISGAASAGIMTALSVPLATAGLAVAPVSVPVSIVLGAGINKVIAPAFGRGDYAKILGEAKYYQNLQYAYDDLVNAIAMTEQQFASIIDEYQRQLQVHAELKNANVQLAGLHNVADQQIRKQSSQISDTFGALGDLYNKI